MVDCHVATLLAMTEFQIFRFAQDDMPHICGGKFPPLYFPSSRNAKYQTIGNISNIGSIGLPDNTLTCGTLHLLFLFYPLYLYYLFRFTLLSVGSTPFKRILRSAQKIRRSFRNDGRDTPCKSCYSSAATLSETSALTSR